MKQTAVEFLHSEYKRIFGDVLVKPNQVMEMADALNKAKEIEKEENKNLYSEEDLKYAFDSGRVRLTFGKERPFVFKKYEDFIKHFKNK